MTTNRRTVSCRTFFLWGGVLGLTVGCGRGPEVSPAAYELAKGIDTLCNLQQAAQVPQARAILKTKLTAGEITASEHAALDEVLEFAASGDWSSARSTTRQILIDQTERK